MFSIILITHAAVARSMKQGVAMIMGKEKKLFAISVQPGDAPEKIEQNLERYVIRELQKNDVVVLSDFPLGTPFNTACRLMEQHHVFHLTGVSMPLVLALLKGRTTDGQTATVCEEAMEQAKAQMFNVNDYVRRLQANDKEVST